MNPVGRWPTQKWPLHAVPDPPLLATIDVNGRGEEIRVFNRSVGWREGTVATVEVEVIEGNVIITVRRIDEAATGPISVVMV